MCSSFFLGNHSDVPPFAKCSDPLFFFFFLRNWLLWFVVPIGFIRILQTNKKLVAMMASCHNSFRQRRKTGNTHIIYVGYGPAIAGRGFRRRLRIKAQCARPKVRECACWADLVRAARPMVTFLLGSGQVPSCPGMSTMARRRARGLRRERAPRRDTTCRRPLAMSTASAPVGVGRRWPARTNKLRRWPTGAGCRDLLCSAHALLRVCMPAWCGVGWNGLLALHAPCAMFRNYSLYLRCRGLSGHA